MNDLMVFNNPEFGEIRTLEVNGEGWFVGVDVAKALGYVKPRGALDRHVDEDDSLIRGVIDGIGREQQTRLINESGVYALIIMSELPSAKKFKRWVTKDVLPSIRKTGGYVAAQMTPNELIAQMAQANVQFEKRLDCIEEKQSEQFHVLEEKMQQSQEKLETTLKVFSQPSQDHWKTDMDNAIEEMVSKYKRSPTGFRGQLYKELEAAAGGVNLNTRHKNLQKRLRKQGHTYVESVKASKLDAISKDKKLRAIMEGIVKKHQALLSQRFGH